jgi:hypothetical protein
VISVPAQVAADGRFKESQKIDGGRADVIETVTVRQ